MHPRVSWSSLVFGSLSRTRNTGASVYVPSTNAHEFKQSYFFCHYELRRSDSCAFLTVARKLNMVRYVCMRRHYGVHFAARTRYQTIMIVLFPVFQDVTPYSECITVWYLCDDYISATVETSKRKHDGSAKSTTIATRPILSCHYPRSFRKSFAACTA